MITCETTNRMWTVEGKIETVHEGAGDLHRTHMGIGELSYLLAQYAGRWAKVRVELIEGPRQRPELADIEGPRAVARESKVIEELKRMRSLATKVRELMAARASAHTLNLEEHCIETMADTVLVVCEQIEQLDRRLQSLEGVGR
jgi:hypothetical protein